MNKENFYFAAANGYNGFKSYFDTVFRSEDYERIYVLKGGPGTGKSSFMKSVLTELKKSGCECESIYCSSDPSSLDGIICENEDKKIAILDGTAPHERDAVIPGAIDEIINLGDSWDEKWLIAEREKILLLNQEKKKAYKTAYSYLKIAGTTQKEKDSLYFAVRNNKKLILDQKFLAETACESKHSKVSTRLISSFGKLGKYRFNTIDENADKLYSIIGEEHFSYVLMNEILNATKNSGEKIIHCPSPFDEKKTEAIYLPESGIAYIVGGNGEKIMAEEYFLKNDDKETEYIRKISEISNAALNEAERWFMIASDFHFRLEDIYSRAMNFESNDEILKNKLSQLKECLGL